MTYCLEFLRTMEAVVMFMKDWRKKEKGIMSNSRFSPDQKDLLIARESQEYASYVMWAMDQAIRCYKYGV